jgi:small subunit ribosomal protein S6
LRGYETCLITHPEISEEAMESLLGKLHNSISSHNGKVLKTEKWGKKRLQYPIKKQQKANFCFLCYMGNNQILDEISHFLRFNENVLRYQTVKIEDVSSLPTHEAVVEIKETEEENNISDSDTQQEQE